MIKILYFASLRERLGTAAESLEVPPPVATMGDLAALLAARGGAWEQAFDGSQPLMMAVNQQAARPQSVLSDGDEVAFFPPVTGG
jgi:molybdopterin synthase sulfur carrier subunit